MKYLTQSISRQTISPILANAFLFSALCALLFWIVDKSGYGFQIGMLWGAVYGLIFYQISRKINQFMGDGTAGLFTNGFSGTIAGTLSSFTVHLFFGLALDKFIISIFGDMSIGAPQLAFYTIVEGAFLGGGFGVAQTLIFGKLNRAIYSRMNDKTMKELTDGNSQEEAQKVNKAIPEKEKSNV